MSNLTEDRAVVDEFELHRTLYDGPGIEGKVKSIIINAPQSKLSNWDIHRILRTARSVFFDTHVEVVSGHHTPTYLRFESIARIPQLVRLIARDMADWITHRYTVKPITGLVAPSSDAQFLAIQIADILRHHMPLRIVLTPFNRESGIIGTEVDSEAINSEDRFLVLNDVTTRGNCVNKLAKIVTDHGGKVAGMMVFARRDSGQFPLMDELTTKFPFYYTANLNMPQWDAKECPQCRSKEPLLSWRDMPEL